MIFAGYSIKKAGRGEEIALLCGGSNRPVQGGTENPCFSPWGSEEKIVWG